MRYLITNKDSSVAIVQLVPIKIVRNSDGLEAINLRYKKVENQKSSVIFGEGVENNVPFGVEFKIGDESYDIADLTDNHIDGWTIVFPDIQIDIIAKWMPEAREAVSSVRVIEKNEIPEDRYFRNAWQSDGSDINIDFAKAKQIHLNKLRRFRKPLLEDLDKEFIIADERTDKKKKSEVAARKQALRDITVHPFINAAKKPEELRLLTIEKLLNG